MKNIVCRNSWKAVGCCDGTTDTFLHGIQIVNGNKILGDFMFPFNVFMKKGTIHFIVNGKESVFQINEFEETREQIKSIIKSCAIGTYGTPLERREVVTIVDTDPVQIIVLPLLAGEAHSGIYDVYINSQNVNQGSELNEFTVLGNGDIQLNEELPVLDPNEEDQYIVTVRYWVTV